MPPRRCVRLSIAGVAGEMPQGERDEYGRDGDHIGRAVDNQGDDGFDDPWRWRDSQLWRLCRPAKSAEAAGIAYLDLTPM